MGEDQDDEKRLVKGRKPYEEEERRTIKRRPEAVMEEANRRLAKVQEDKFKEDKRTKKGKEEDFKDSRILKGKDITRNNVDAYCVLLLGVKVRNNKCPVIIVYTVLGDPGGRGIIDI